MSDTALTSSDPDDARYWPMIGGRPCDPRNVALREFMFRSAPKPAERRDDKNEPRRAVAIDYYEGQELIK